MERRARTAPDAAGVIGRLGREGQTEEMTGGQQMNQDRAKSPAPKPALHGRKAGNSHPSPKAGNSHPSPEEADELASGTQKAENHRYRRQTLESAKHYLRPNRGALWLNPG